MILMIKNAHHFNEPGSEIYKVGLATPPGVRGFESHPVFCSASDLLRLVSLFLLYVSVELLQMASSLRKFIISHCAELERRYHTVPK